MFSRERRRRTRQVESSPGLLSTLIMGSQPRESGSRFTPRPWASNSVVSQPPWPAAPLLSQATKQERRHELWYAAASRRRHDASPAPKVGEGGGVQRERMQRIRMAATSQAAAGGQARPLLERLLRPYSSSCRNAVLLAAGVARGSEQPMRKAAVKRIIQGRARDSPITMPTPRPRYPYLALAGLARRAQPMEARDVPRGGQEAEREIATRSQEGTGSALWLLSCWPFGLFWVFLFSASRNRGIRCRVPRLVGSLAGGGGSGPHARVWQMFEMHAAWGLDLGLDLGAVCLLGLDVCSTRISNYPGAAVPRPRPHAPGPTPMHRKGTKVNEPSPGWTGHRGLAPTNTTPCLGREG